MQLLAKTVTLGSTDCKHLIQDDFFEYAKEQYCSEIQLLVDEDYRLYATLMCEAYGLSYPPATHEDALLIYLILKDDGDSLQTS